MLSDIEREIQARADAVLEKEAQKKRDKETRFAVALESVMATHQGRAVLKKILSLCPIDHISYAQDPCATAYNEGIRTVGVQIKFLLGKDNYRLVEDEEI